MADALRALGIPTVSVRRTWFIRIVVALVIVASILGIGYAIRKRYEPALVAFTKETVRRGDVRATVTATGSLRALNTVDIGPEISGRVARVLVDFNDRVTVGQVLVELDTEQLRAGVAEARANVAQAVAAVRLARATREEMRERRERTVALRERGLAATAEETAANASFERANAEVATADARLAVARAALTQSEANVRRAEIRSPIDGMVLSRSVEPGQTVAATFQTPVLFTLAEDLTRLELRVDIDEADIGRVREGQSAKFIVDAFSDRTFDATIRALHYAPRTVSNVVTYEGILTVDNRDRLLRPGMTATTQIETDTRTNVLLVSNPALRFVPPNAREIRFNVAPRPESQGPVLWVLRDGRPTAVAVEVGVTDGRVSEIRRGIAENTEVLVDVARPVAP